MMSKQSLWRMVVRRTPQGTPATGQLAARGRFLPALNPVLSPTLDPVAGSIATNRLLSWEQRRIFIQEVIYGTDHHRGHRGRSHDLALFAMGEQ